MAFLGIFLISTGILALQILQTRIFSFTLWHHLAYMVITVALMGMGASGTWLAIKKKEPEKPFRFLSVSSILFSISSLISLAVAVRIPLDTYMNDKALQLGYIFLYYMLLVFPYFFAGVTISFMFRHIREKINIYYLANLTGSAIGGLLVLPVIEIAGAEGAVIMVLLIGVFSALLFSVSGRDKPLIVAGTVLLLMLTALYPARKTLLPISACPSKALGAGYIFDPDQKIVHTEWNRVARIDVFENKNSQKFFNYFPELNNKVITIDGDAYTLLYDFPSASENMGFLIGDIQQNPKRYLQVSAFDFGKEVYINTKDDASAKDIVFKVHLLSTKTQLGTTADVFKSIDDVEEYSTGNVYNYFTGSTSKYSEIEEIYQTVRFEFPESSIVAFKNGQLIKLKKALKQIR